MRNNGDVPYGGRCKGNIPVQCLLPSDWPIALPRGVGQHSCSTKSTLKTVMLMDSLALALWTDAGGDA